jgi:hypothetical protein
MSEATLEGGGVGVCMSFDASWSECTETRAGRGRGRPEGGRRRGAELKALSKDRLLAVRSAAKTDLGNGRCQHDGRTVLTSQGEGGAVGQEGATGGRRLRRCARLHSPAPNSHRHFRLAGERRRQGVVPPTARSPRRRPSARVRTERCLVSLAVRSRYGSQLLPHSLIRLGRVRMKCPSAAAPTAGCPKLTGEKAVRRESRPERKPSGVSDAI